jgi:threonine 3-dehydrogenase
VSLESHIWCGSCYQCHNAKPHLCARTRYPGIDLHGGLAEYLVVPSRIAWKHGKPLSVDVAAMFEPFGLAVHASLEGDGVSGRDVLITGCGPIGLMNVAVARALGAAQVIATDVNPKRLAAAKQAGADRVIDVKDEDPVAITRDMTRGRGADVVFEYSGQATALEQAVQAVTAGGEIRLVGAPEAAIPVDLTTWIMKGITVRSVHGRKIFGSWEQASRLVESGKVDLAPLVSHRIPLRDGVESFHLIERGEAVKVLVVPDA